MPTRIEHDSLGPVEIDSGQLWGAQTQRSLEFFRISSERMPVELIHALAQVKRAAAVVNRDGFTYVFVLAQPQPQAQPGGMEVRTSGFNVFPRTTSKDGKIAGWQGRAQVVWPRVLQPAAGPAWRAVFLPCACVHPAAAAAAFSYCCALRRGWFAADRKSVV
mgnify:CR=1 FL=1